MRTLLMLLVLTLSSADPAWAGRNRLTAFLEVTYTPDAKRHRVGVGVGAEFAFAFNQRTRFSPQPEADGNWGAGLRARLFGDGSVDLALEPIIGLIAGAPHLLCGSEFPLTVSADFRPGLVIRSRGGPGLSVGGAVTGVLVVFPFRAHVSTVVPFRENPRNPPRAPGRTQDATIGVGTGLSLATFGCPE